MAYGKLTYSYIILYWMYHGIVVAKLSQEREKILPVKSQGTQRHGTFQSIVGVHYKADF